jgi:hypothetical protein
VVVRWLNVVLGLWLAAAAFLLAPPGAPARTADLADGAALILVSLLAPPGTPAGFSAIVLGMWIMWAPVFVGYAGRASVLDDIAVGFAAVALALHPGFLRRPARA